MFGTVHRVRRRSSPYGSGGGPDDYAIEVFFDGDCPLCRREIELLRRLDRSHRLRLTNIAAPGFQPEQYGRTMQDLMAELHGRLPDGNWVTGMDAFRRVYSAVGFGWLASISRLPGLRQMGDAAYRVFARNRLRWTDRCDDRCRIPEAH